MKIDKSLLNKLIKLSVVAGYFAKQNKRKVITEIEIFLALIFLFSLSVDIKSFFLDYGLDIDRVIRMLSKKYVFPTNLSFNLSQMSFVYSKSTYELLEKLSSLKDDAFVPLLMLIDLLSMKKVIEFSTNVGILDLLLMLDFKWLVDKFYSDKKIQKQMLKILNSKIDIIKQEQDYIEIFFKTIDEFSDFDLEDEDINNTNTDVMNSTDDKTKLALDTFGVNLNKLAQEGKLEPVVGRENEIKQVIYTLLRKTKNNPLLVGEAWVGKTAIVEGLVQRIVEGKVPDKLKNKKIYMLDMGSLVAWTKYRGEFEARLKQVISEATNPENNIILFIDEIHTIIWAWNAEWGADTANLLKPYLARWELTLIGATTFNEYQKYIEKDPALTRRFQLIKVEEPSEEEAIKLLEWIKYRFEDFHWVNITKEAVERAVYLSKRYILDRHLPDKAIDLIDEAAARKSTFSLSKQAKTKIKRLENKIENLEKKIQQAIEEQNYFEAADYKNEIKKLQEQIHQIKSASSVPKELRPTLTAEDIDKVVAEKYGISSKVLSKSELEFLTDLENQLNKEIIWQEEAVKEVVSALIRNKLSPVEKTKPIGAFLFLWPSGVGKTYLAELLAKYFFHDDKALIKINMSEYSESISSSKLIWASAGYVGYEEWGILTEAVRKKPYSVVLFDEIEKGSPQVLNILLQILDQGYLEDNKWRKVDFKNTIVILTSNLGAEYFNKDITKVGFDTSEDKNTWLSEEKKELILNEVKNLFPIELLNRLDKIVFFNPVKKDTLEKIFKKYYSEYKKLWKNKKWVNVPRISSKEIDNLLEKVEKEGSWVRWIEKFIYNELENKIIQKLLSQKIKEWNWKN